MPLISRLPSGGGGGKPGIKDGKGLVNLNIFTQQDEPKTKDGIWIKTNNKYQRVIVDKQYLNSAEGVWRNPVQAGSIHNSKSQLGVGQQACEYNGNIAMIVGTNGTINLVSLDVEKQTITLMMKLYDTIKTNLVYVDSMVNYDEKLFMNVYKYMDNRNVFEMYKYEGGSINKVANFPEIVRSYCKKVLVFNNKIYYFYVESGNPSSLKAYIYDPIANTSTYANIISHYLVTSAEYYEAIVYKGLIYIFVKNSGYNGLSLYGTWDGITKPNINVVEQLPIPVTYKAYVWNGEVHLISASTTKQGAAGVSIRIYHYIWDGSSSTNVGSFSTEANVSFDSAETFSTNNQVVPFNDKICLLMSKYIYMYYTMPEKVYDKQTVIFNKGATNTGKYLTNIVDTASVISGDGSNNRFISGFDDCFYFAETGFDWTAPMYYGDGTKWIKFKN